MFDIEVEIRGYIATNLLFEDRFNYSDDASFLREGIIDSLGVMELVTFVSSRFSITVDPQEVTPENFDSVANLAAYVSRKQGENKVISAQPSLPQKEQSQKQSLAA